MTWSKPNVRDNRCAMVKLDEFLNCKSGASPCATRSDNSPATLSFHSDQKPVGTFSFGNRWLVRAFHVYSSSEIRKARYYKALRHKCQAYFTFLPVDKFALAM